MKLNSLHTYHFFVFIGLLSLIAVHWAFSHIQSLYPQFFGYTMWTLFTFYTIGFLVLGSLLLEEIIDRAIYRRKIRRLELAHQGAVTGKIKADTKLIISKANQSEVKQIEAPMQSNNVILVDLSEAIKIKPQYPLIDTVSKYARILVVGGQDAGKTSVMLWLAEAKMKLGNVVAIDTHASPEKWPREAHVLGFGLDYNQAQRGFNQVLDLMTKRYDEIGQGRAKERSHPIISVLTDEWTDLPDMIPNFKKQYVKPLFTKSRKAAIDLSLAAHDDTVEALGMEGLSGLKKSFDVVIYLDYSEGKHTSIVQYGLKKSTSKRVECLPPGPYVPNGKPLQPVQNYIDFNTFPGVLSQDIRVLEAIRMNYDSQINGSWKQLVRKDLGIPASQEGYKIIDTVGERYNLTLK